MTDAEYSSWLAHAIVAYAADKTASGQWTESEAIALSTKEYAELLPEGLATPDNFLFAVVNEIGSRVGTLWFARQTKFGAPIAYVYDLEIHPNFQRQGHGTRALRLLEVEVAARSLSGIALHVFGHNAPARALYASLGYEPTNISLFKAVRREA